MLQEIVLLFKRFMLFGQVLVDEGARIVGGERS
jgi:hypothetical protein